MTTTAEAEVEVLDDGIDEILAAARIKCHKGCLLGQDEVSGRFILVPLCCKSWGCPDCGPRLQDQWAQVACRGEPQRFLTITADPELHESPRAARIAIKNATMKFIAHWRRGKVRKDGKHTIPAHEIEYIMAWELHISGWPHLHILVRGPYIPQGYLKRWMIVAKVGSIVHVKAVTNTRASVSELLKYTVKAAQSDTDVFTGSRVVTKSRHYDPGGAPPVRNDNTPGYQWVRIPTRAIDVYQYLTGVYQCTVIEGSFPDRFQLDMPGDPIALDQLYLEICRRLRLPS